MIFQTYFVQIKVNKGQTLLYFDTFPQSITFMLM